MAKKKRKRQKQKPAATAEPRRASRLPLVCLAVILALALAIRIYPVMFSPETFRAGLGIFDDSYLYNAIAYNLYKGNGFSGTDYGGSLGRGENKPGLKYEPAIVRAPLYPFFMAGVYKMFGGEEDIRSRSTWRTNFDKVRLTQCVLDAFVWISVFLIAWAVYPASTWPGLIADGLTGRSSRECSRSGGR